MHSLVSRRNRRRVLVASTGATWLLLAAPATPSSYTITFATPVTVSTTAADENALLTFNGTAGQRVSLRMAGVTFGTSTCCSTKVSVRKPDGTTLVLPFNVGTQGGFMDPKKLPVTGAYKILVDPQGAVTGSMTLTLYNVPADVSAPITAGGAAVTVKTTTPGQNARLPFSGTAGERVSLRMTGVTMGTSTCCGVRVSIATPTGSSLFFPTSVGTNGGFIDTKVLPSTGTYKIVVDPQGAATGSMTLSLARVPADASASIVPGGPAITFNIGTPGQNGNVSFTGSAGQRVSLLMSNVTMGTSSCCSVRVKVVKPDGSTLVSPLPVGVGGGFVDTVALPVAGTYKINVDPQDAATGSMTMRLYNVPADASASTTVGGSAATVSPSVPGQNGRVTFTGTNGQSIKLTLSGVTIGTSSCCGSKVSLLRPDGAAVFLPFSVGTNGMVRTTTLTMTGTYKVVVDPVRDATGSMTVGVSLAP